jgi:hypothetical protein
MSNQKLARVGRNSSRLSWEPTGFHQGARIAGARGLNEQERAKVHKFKRESAAALQVARSHGASESE